MYAHPETPYIPPSHQRKVCVAKNQKKKKKKKMSTNNHTLPLDPDLFNPDIVGESSLFLGQDENFYPNEEPGWDDNDLDYETEEETSEEDQQLSFKGGLKSKPNRTNQKRTIRDLAASSAEDEDDSSAEDEDSDHEPDPVSPILIDLVDPLFG
jgi:hypothetical protein